MYDLIIVGGGPAGMSAAIYSARQGIKFLVIDSPEPSQIETATKVENYPGIKRTTGPELQKLFEEHAKSLGAEIIKERVMSIQKDDEGFLVVTDENSYRSKSIIIATGAKHRKANIKGEEEFSGKGVSYCATCDGPLFKGKKVLVVGGGDAAVSSAIYLQKQGCITTLIHRRDELRAEEALERELMESDVRIIWDSVVSEIKGDGQVKSVVIKNVKTGEEREEEFSGVFIAVGTVPVSEITKNLGIEVNEAGFIKVDRKQKTNVDGVYAAGDVCDNPLKQVVTACADGAIAAVSVLKDIKGKKDRKRMW